MRKSECPKCQKKKLEAAPVSNHSHSQLSWGQANGNEKGMGAIQTKQEGSHSSHRDSTNVNSPLQKMNSNVLRSYQQKASNLQMKSSTESSPRVQRQATGTTSSLIEENQALKTLKEKHGDIIQNIVNMQNFARGQKIGDDENVALCNSVEVMVELRDDYIPRYLRGRICGKDRRALSGYGSCQESTATQPIQKIPSDWELFTNFITSVNIADLKKRLANSSSVESVLFPIVNSIIHRMQMGILNKKPYSLTDFPVACIPTVVAGSALHDFISN